MKSVPKDIWLQIGEDTPSDADFYEIDDITWSDRKQEVNDIHYVNADAVLDKIKRIEETAEYSEDDSSDMVSIFVLLDELKEMLTEGGKQ